MFFLVPFRGYDVTRASGVDQMNQVWEIVSRCVQVSKSYFPLVTDLVFG